MILRDATEQDADPVAGIWTYYIRETLATFNSADKTPEDVATLIRTRQGAGRAFIVAEDEGRIIGFATYDQFRGGAGYARTMEHTIQLAPGASGKGAGRALMAAIEDHARAAGHGVMIAGVSSGNPDGVAFHARLGYREVARLPAVGWKNDTWWDLHVMEKRLSTD